MAVDRARLIARWPHFEEAPESTVDEAINAARLRVGSIFGALRDEATMLLAAHTVACDPGGQFARLVAKDGSTTYEKAFDRLCSEFQNGDRLI